METIYLSVAVVLVGFVFAAACDEAPSRRTSANAGSQRAQRCSVLDEHNKTQQAPAIDDRALFLLFRRGSGPFGPGVRLHFEARWFRRALYNWCANSSLYSFECKFRIWLEAPDQGTALQLEFLTWRFLARTSRCFVLSPWAGDRCAVRCDNARLWDAPWSYSISK